MHQIVSNIQFYHQCSEAVEAVQKEDETEDVEDSDSAYQACSFGDNSDIEMEEEVEMADGLGEQISEESLASLLKTHYNLQEQAYVDSTMEIARGVYMFSTEDKPWTPLPLASRADADAEKSLFEWKKAMEQEAERLFQDASNQIPSGESQPSNSGNTSTIEVLTNSSKCQSNSQPTIEVVDGEANDDGMGHTSQALIGDNLLEDQKWAFNTIKAHLQCSLSESNTPQLLMVIQGEPGTRKSKVIQTVTQLFELMGQGTCLL
ncbi:hypothetical protein FRB99_006578 [Tulasnella sp. 403]|nr:hypothetical protein FRB99_006578 [Tulasnella sp. 403]